MKIYVINYKQWMDAEGTLLNKPWCTWTKAFRSRSAAEEEIKHLEELDIELERTIYIIDEVKLM